METETPQPIERKKHSRPAPEDPRVAFNTKLSGRNYRWLYEMKAKGYVMTKVIDEALELLRTEYEKQERRKGGGPHGNVLPRKPLS